MTGIFMLFRNLVNTNMGLMMLCSFALSLVCPLLLFYVQKRFCLNRFLRICLLVIYILIVLYLTVFNRSQGENYSINTSLFWSYEYFHLAQYRWQIYMNILLFIPFGFLLPFSTSARFCVTVFLGLILSIIIESAQYIWGLGLCEIDDIFHNTIGSILGYIYWISMEHYFCN